MAIHFLGAERVDGNYLTIPDGSPFWRIVDFVDHEVVLERFTARYEPLGRSAPPYDPRLMIVAWLWCAIHQGCSPSAAARRCRWDQTLIAWFGDRVPARTTLRNFLVVHRQAWRALLPAAVAVAARLGLLDATVTATDGTVFGAPGSLRQARPLWWLRWQIRETRQALADAEAQMLAQCAGGAGAPMEVVLAEAFGAGLARQRGLHRRLAGLQAAEAQCLAPDPIGEEPATAARREQLSQWQGRQEATVARMVDAQQRKYDHDQRVRAAGPRSGAAAVAPEDAKQIQDARQRLENTKKNCVTLT